MYQKQCAKETSFRLVVYNDTKKDPKHKEANDQT